MGMNALLEIRPHHKYSLFEAFNIPRLLYVPILLQGRLQMNTLSMCVLACLYKLHLNLVTWKREKKSTWTTNILQKTEDLKENFLGQEVTWVQFQLKDLSRNNAYNASRMHSRNGRGWNTNFLKKISMTNLQLYERDYINSMNRHHIYFMYLFV